MSKCKFKVGDFVKLKKNVKLGDCIDGYTILTSMYEDLQKSRQIKEITYLSSQGIYVATVAGWYVPFNSLKFATAPEKIIIYRNGTEVVAKNTATGKTGVAKCNPADEFDFNTGAKLAFERLTNSEPEKPKKPKYYTGKVVCVTPFTSFYTKGKVYEIKDGVGKNDEGNKMTNRPVKSFAEFRQNMVSKFIELVE